MTGFWPGLASFVIALASVNASEMVLKLSSSAGRFVAGAALVVALYCVGLGVFHAINDWAYIDLFGAADEQGVSTSGRKAVALSLMQFWPFVMILAGLAAIYVNGRVYRAHSLRV